MEVILLENIKKLGTIGQKVKVKDGYGRNFLIKKNKALLANKKNMEIFNKRKDEITKKNELEQAKSNEIAIKLKSLKLEIKKEAMENKQLYGSVSVKEIVNLLNSNNIKISADKVEIKNQIKSLGTHKIYINLHAEVQSNVDIEIKPIS